VNFGWRFRCPWIRWFGGLWRLLLYEEVNLPIAQTKNSLNGWWIPSENSNAPVLLYFHHNAINIGANVSQALQFHRLGYSIFIFDYRGFGKSKGPFPTEPQLYADAQTAWDYLTQTRHIPADRNINLPVLIVTGTNDIQIPVSMGERLYAAALGPKKQLIIIPGGSHDNHLSAAHRQAMQQFLNPLD
jgi:fermentation-respiration switch protein FrsA (DUF1100 family)